MLTEPGGPFLDLSKLDLHKYAQKPALARVLFEYLYYHENDTKNALEVASLSTTAAKYQDWWWKVSSIVKKLNTKVVYSLTLPDLCRYSWVSAISVWGCSEKPSNRFAPLLATWRR